MIKELKTCIAWEHSIHVYVCIQHVLLYLLRFACMYVGMHVCMHVCIVCFGLYVSVYACMHACASVCYHAWLCCFCASMHAYCKHTNMSWHTYLCVCLCTCPSAWMHTYAICDMHTPTYTYTYSWTFTHKYCGHSYVYPRTYTRPGGWVHAKTYTQIITSEYNKTHAELQHYAVTLLLILLYTPSGSCSLRLVSQMNTLTVVNDLTLMQIGVAILGSASGLPRPLLHAALISRTGVHRHSIFRIPWRLW